MTEALRRLVELAEAEHELVASGQAEAIAAVQDGLAEALAELPSFLDTESRARLAEAYALRERTIALLRAARDEAAAEVAKLDHGRSAVRGYAPAGMSAGTSTVDSSV